MSAAPNTRSFWQRLGWLAGLPVLGLAWAGVTIVTAPFVAQSLKKAAIQASGPDRAWLHVEVRGRDLLVSGEAPEPALRKAAHERLSAIEGVRRLIEETGPSAQKPDEPAATSTITPLVEGFRFTVERRPDGGFALRGDAASDAVRAEMRAAAAALTEGAPVEDALRNAPSLSGSVDASALSAFAIRLAGLLQVGSVRYDASGLAVSGEALDPEAAAEITALMRDQRPTGVPAGQVAVANHPVSPYEVRIRREADAVVLSGHLPDAGTREAVLDALRPRLFDVAIRDRTRLSDGAPPELAGALSAAVVPLTLLASGDIVVSDRTLRLTGESLYRESARRLNDRGLGALPTGWQGSVSIGVRDSTNEYDAPTCTRLFAERIAGKTLRFSPGSSELKPEFYPLLDAVADLAGHCSRAQILVTGHGDPAGTAAPKPVPLPEMQDFEKQAAESQKKAKPQPTKPQPAKAEAAKAQSGKSQPGKTQVAAGKPNPSTAEPAKPDPATSEPPPELPPDLPRARALAIVDYLQKAGVAGASVAPDGAPLTVRQGIGLALRS